jgi:hypothetical protein
LIDVFYILVTKSNSDYKLEQPYPTPPLPLPYYSSPSPVLFFNLNSPNFFLFLALSLF